MNTVDKRLTERFELFKIYKNGKFSSASEI